VGNTSSIGTTIARILNLAKATFVLDVTKATFFMEVLSSGAGRSNLPQFRGIQNFCEIRLSKGQHDVKISNNIVKIIAINVKTCHHEIET
jgi:hypothetical protein